MVRREMFFGTRFRKKSEPRFFLFPTLKSLMVLPQLNPYLWTNDFGVVGTNFPFRIKTLGSVTTGAFLHALPRHFLLRLRLLLASVKSVKYKTTKMTSHTRIILRVVCWARRQLFMSFLFLKINFKYF